MIKLPAHKCGLYLQHNPHKDDYQTPKSYIDNIELADDFKDNESMQRSIDTNELWILQWYPDTPIGFIRAAAPSLEELLQLVQ